MSARAFLPALLLASSCTTEPHDLPSLTGRWAGTVESPLEARLTLNLEEGSRGAVSGWGTFMFRGHDGAYRMDVIGQTTPDRVALTVSNPQAVTWTLELTYLGPDLLTGHTVNDWAVQLERIQ